MFDADGKPIMETFTDVSNDEDDDLEDEPTEEENEEETILTYEKPGYDDGEDFPMI